MKNTLISALLMAFVAFAFIENANSAGETATPKTPSQGSIRQYEAEFSGVEDFARIVKDLNCNSNDIKYDTNGCKLISWIKKKGIEYKICKDFFADDNGQLGPYGRAMAERFAVDFALNREKSVFYSAVPDQERLCPGYKEMTPMQKVAFHTWVWELTALPESTCKAEVKDNTSKAVPRGKAVCMYQLEYPKDTREWRSNRPSKTNPKDEKGNGIKYCAVPESEIRSLLGCTNCAFDGYKDHLISRGYLFGQWNEDASPKRDHQAQWAAHNFLNPKQRAEVAEYEKCRATNKCASDLHMNEKIAARDVEDRIPRFPLCKTPQAAKELADLK
jgi:hypothetical protein